MKRYTLALLTCFILPVMLRAQLTVTNAEFYHIGDVIKMLNVDATNAHADTGGANVTWDYSSLQPLGNVFSTTTVMQDTFPQFANSNILEILPNGRYAHIQENSSATYINAITDPVTNTTADYYRYKVETRPISYHSSFLDSFRVVDIGNNRRGSGYVKLTGDGYGTLHLPGGTFNNVLRVRRYQWENDTISGGAVTTLINVSYMWFDNVHAAPLFRIDSSTSAGGITASASYLPEAMAVHNVPTSQGSYNCAIHNDELQVTGKFEHGQAYHVVLYSLLGSKVFASDFVATDPSQHFATGRMLTPGIYVVSIALKNDAGSREVMKVVKQ